MRKVIAIFFLMALPMMAFAQKAVVVEPLVLLENSQADVMYNNEFGRFVNNELDDPFPYAVIRVELEGDGGDVREAKARLGLDLGSMYKVENVVTEKTNCVLFLVPRGVKNIYLMCGDGCEKLLLYSGGTLRMNKVYKCKVRYYKEESSPRSANVLASRQYLQINVEPKTASVMIDGEYVMVEDGVASVMLNFGRHTYTVEAESYHSQTADIDISDPKNKVVRNVSLNPAFGYLSIAASGELGGAVVYLNKKQIGTIPLTRYLVPSGEHGIRIMKAMYKSYEQQITISDGQELSLKPQLVADFATVTLKASDGVEIWANGEKKGVGSWNGRLFSGEYLFETKRESHRPVAVTKKIDASSGGVIKLEDPTPIYGAVDISVRPMNAEVLIDGKVVGTTPLFLQEVLIGKRNVVVRKAGCAENKWQVQVSEGQITNVEGKLAEGQEVRLSCGVAGARWTVDGVDRGVGAEITVNLSYAEHSVKIEADEYVDFEERFSVSVGTASRTFVMQRIDRDVETITVNGVTFRMRRVEGGTFQMGSNNGGSDEKPVHSVTLSDYYIGETEVTQALWEAVMGSNPSNWKGDNLPVESVSWNDCQEFIKKLNEKIGRTFALPTEAQWEYAARGGNKSRGYTYAGSNTIDNVAWYWDNGSKQTHPVGSKQANELGLYDMSGNVWELCSDWYSSNYYWSSPSTNPTGVSSESYRVLRGGSWISNASGCRSTHRSCSTPDRRDDGGGLRLVLLP